ncbi:MAG: HipA N-terminal domain-containing protein [Labilibaculum antarcticum]
MIEKFKKILRRSEGFEEVSTLGDSYVQFSLKYRDLVIGTLTLDGDEWIYEYSEDFKYQKGITPLANFPNLDKEYRSNELWSFFSSRIPSLTQLLMRNESIEENTVDLLKKYGVRTITNPFVLTTAG